MESRALDVMKGAIKLSCPWKFTVSSLYYSFDSVNVSGILNWDWEAASTPNGTRVSNSTTLALDAGTFYFYPIVSGLCVLDFRVVISKRKVLGSNAKRPRKLLTVCSKL